MEPLNASEAKPLVDSFKYRKDYFVAYACIIHEQAQRNTRTCMHMQYAARGMQACYTLGVHRQVDTELGVQGF